MVIFMTETFQILTAEQLRQVQDELRPPEINELLVQGRTNGRIDLPIDLENADPSQPDFSVQD